MPARELRRHLGTGLFALWILGLHGGGTPGTPPEPTRAWRVDSWGRGEPVVVRDTVYFLTRAHEVVAVDARHGTVRWRRSTREPGVETLGSAVVATPGGIVAGDYDLVCFDEAAGGERWRFSPGEGYGPGLYLGDAGGDTVFAGSPAARLYAVRTADGVAAWATAPVRAGRVTVYQPEADGPDVAAGFTAFDSPSSGGVVLVDAATGRERWRRTFPSSSGAGDETPGFGGGIVLLPNLVVAASGDGRLFAYERRTGNTRWRLPAVARSDGREQGRDWRALTVSGSTLVAGSASGVVTAWDLRTREVRWRFQHPQGGSTGARLTVADGTVFVPHLGGLLVALDVRTGRLQWQTGGGDEGFSWAPGHAGGRVFAAARAGLFALVPAAGSQAP
jgi:outer membrane protein assembly factor BamB